MRTPPPPQNTQLTIPVENKSVKSNGKILWVLLAFLFPLRDTDMRKSLPNCFSAEGTIQFRKG